jgi:signal transduction histidine kinase
MAHRSLTIDPPTEMLVPLHTAVRLLRIMLSINLVLAIVGIVFPGLYFGVGASVLVALTSWPTALVWVFVMLPGLTRRFGRYYLPVCIVLTIAAQSIENGLDAFLNPRTFDRARDFFTGRPGGGGPFGFGGVPFEARAVEPLFLIIAASVLGAWAYGRRGGYATTGLAAVLLLVSNLADVFGGGEARLVFPLFAFRVILILVVGFIVGTLAEQERKQTIELSAANIKLREQTSAIEQLATARERNRLARDLHDTLAHSLAGLVVQLGAIDTLMQS